MALKELFDNKKLKNNGNYGDDEISEVEKTFTKSKIDEKEKVIVGLNQELTSSYVKGIGEWIHGEVGQKNLNSLADPSKKALIDFLYQKITIFGETKQDIQNIKDLSKKNIAIIQGVLLFLGYNRGNLKINGEFDEATFMALAQYQTFSNTYNYTNNGKVNFIVTENVLKSLMQDLGGYQKAISQGPKTEIRQTIISGEAFGQKDGSVGSVDVSPEQDKQKITMTSSQLSDEIIKKLNESGNKEFAERLNKTISQKGTTYQLFWSLIQNDANMFGNQKDYEGVSGWFKERSRAIDVAPIYFGDKVKTIIGAKQQKYEEALAKINEALIKGDFNFAQQGFDYLDKWVFTLTDEEIASMIMNYESNLGTERYEGGFFIKKNDIAKYKKRFDSGDTSSVFEFFSEVMKNDNYTNFMVLGKCKDTVTTLDFLKKNISNLQDENTVNTFMSKQKLDVWGQSFNYPSDINYHEIIEKHVEKSKGKPDLDELTYSIKLEVLKKLENQILSKFDKNSQEYKNLKNFYNDKSFWTNLDRYGSSYVIKGLPLAFLGILVGAGVGVGSAAVAGAVGIESTLGSTALTLVTGLVGQVGITTPVMAFTGSTLAGQSLSESAARLGDAQMWKENLVYNSVSTLIMPVVGILKNAVLAGKIGKGVAAIQGGKYTLTGFNMAKFAGEVGVNIGTDMLFFDGEFTPQEVVNATIFSMMNKATRYNMVKKIGEKISFEQMGDPLEKAKTAERLLKEPTPTKKKEENPFNEDPRYGGDNPRHEGETPPKQENNSTKDHTKEKNPEQPRQKSKPMESTNYKISELDGLSINKIRNNTEADNIKIIQRLEILKKDLILLQEEINLTGDRDKLKEFQYKKSLLLDTENLMKQALGLDKFNFIREKQYLHSLDAATKENLNTLNGMTLVMDRLYCEYLSTGNNNYVSGEGGLMKKIFEYNRKLEMFKNVMGEDFSNVSRFLLDPISGKHMEAFDKKIIPLKQAINLLSAMGVKPNDPQMIEKTQELNRELYLLRNTYGEKRVADFMQSINQRIDRMNARSSGGQSSGEQSGSSSYRAKTEKPQPQKTPEQMQNERVNRISKLSLQQIREEMLILKRDIKSFYGDGKDRGYIEIEINECETTLEKAKKSYNDNDFGKGTRLFDIGKKRTEDLEKKLTNVYDKIQDYFVYTARIKEIGLDKDVQELQLDEKSINPTRFKQFISDVSNLKNMSQEIDKLAQNATKSKPGTDRIYAGF